MSKPEITKFVAKPYKTGKQGLSRVVVVPRSKFKEGILEENTPYEFRVHEVEDL